MKNRLYHYLRLRLLLIFALVITACHGYISQKADNSKTQLPNSDCRVVVHQSGETCIPHNPKRIVVTSADILDPVLALGVKPIAAPEPNLLHSQGRHLGDRVEDIISLGKENGISLEKIVNLKPDLILGFEIDPEKYKLLSKVAPTVSIQVLEPVGQKWKETFQKLAEFLDKSKEAEIKLAQYHQRVTQLKQNVEKRFGGTTVSVARFYADGQIRFNTVFHFSVSILQEVGFSAPPQQVPFANTANRYAVFISLEKLELLDADILFVTLDPGSETYFKEYQENPLWKKLNVVQNNQVYTVDSSYWYGGSILGANAILDDVEKYIFSSSSSTPYSSHAIIDDLFKYSVNPI